MKPLCTAMSSHRLLSTIFSNPALNQSPVAWMPMTREQVNGPRGPVGSGALGPPSGAVDVAGTVGVTTGAGVAGAGITGGEGTTTGGGIGATEGSPPAGGGGGFTGGVAAGGAGARPAAGSDSPAGCQRAASTPAERLHSRSRQKPSGRGRG